MMLTLNTMAGPAHIRGFRLTLSVGALLAAYSIVEASSAQSLRDLRQRDAAERTLDREAAYTSSVCQTSISASIDWRSAADWPDASRLVASCDGALGALEAFCRSNVGRQRAQNISRFVCAGDGSGASMRGRTLRYGASPGDNGFSDTKSLLEGLL